MLSSEDIVECSKPTFASAPDCTDAGGFFNFEQVPLGSVCKAKPASFCGTESTLNQCYGFTSGYRHTVHGPLPLPSPPPLPPKPSPPPPRPPFAPPPEDSLSVEACFDDILEGVAKGSPIHLSGSAIFYPDLHSAMRACLSEYKERCAHVYALFSNTTEGPLERFFLRDSAAASHTYSFLGGSFTKRAACDGSHLGNACLASETPHTRPDPSHSSLGSTAHYSLRPALLECLSSRPKCFAITEDVERHLFHVAVHDATDADAHVPHVASYHHNMWMVLEGEQCSSTPSLVPPVPPPSALPACPSLPSLPPLPPIASPSGSVPGSTTPPPSRSPPFEAPPAPAMDQPSPQVSPWTPPATAALASDGGLALSSDGIAGLGLTSTAILIGVVGAICLVIVITVSIKCLRHAGAPPKEPRDRDLAFTSPTSGGRPSPDLASLVRPSPSDAQPTPSDAQLIKPFLEPHRMAAPQKLLAEGATTHALVASEQLLLRCSQPPLPGAMRSRSLSAPALPLPPPAPLPPPNGNVLLRQSAAKQAEEAMVAAVAAAEPPQPSQISTQPAEADDAVLPPPGLSSGPVPARVAPPLPVQIASDGAHAQRQLLFSPQGQQSGRSSPFVTSTETFMVREMVTRGRGTPMSSLHDSTRWELSGGMSSSSALMSDRSGVVADAISSSEDTPIASSRGPVGLFSPLSSSDLVSDSVNLTVHRHDVDALLKAARKEPPLSSARGPGARQQRELSRFGTQLPEHLRRNPALLHLEMGKFHQLREEGFLANERGDTRTALRILTQAALICPSCSMLLSVANMHLKLGHGQLAAPLYSHVLSCGRATEREALMATSKLRPMLQGEMVAKQSERFAGDEGNLPITPRSARRWRLAGDEGNLPITPRSARRWRQRNGSTPAAAGRVIPPVPPILIPSTTPQVMTGGGSQPRRSRAAVCTGASPAPAGMSARGSARAATSAAPAVVSARRSAAPTVGMPVGGIGTGISDSYAAYAQEDGELSSQSARERPPSARRQINSARRQVRSARSFPRGEAQAVPGPVVLEDVQESSGAASQVAGTSNAPAPDPAWITQQC